MIEKHLFNSRDMDVSGNQHGLKCCFKRCMTQTALDERVEVKTVMPKSTVLKKIQYQFLVNWHRNGEAEFHKECWNDIVALLKSRARKNGLSKEEKSMLKVGREAPEQFDSIESIKASAEHAARWIKEAKHCVAFTGAGISTSAGIGDYRGKAGKWTEDDQNHAIAKSAVFTDDCEEPKSKKQKTERASTSDDTVEETEDYGVPYEKLRPTYTHEALNKLQQTGYLKYIISQNGDGLHGLSGIPGEQISKLHGNVFVEVCEKCERQYRRKFYVMDDEGSQYFEELEDYGETSVKKPKHAKKCELCGLSHRTGRKCESKNCTGYLRDTIINFRDNLEEDILMRAWDTAEDCDVMICLGTTLQVTPACDIVTTMNRKGKLIICNRQETPLDDEFERKGSDGVPKRGCRVFGNCDFFMEEIMKHIYPKPELEKWEKERPDRMKQYDTQRD